jgi:uncharacterized membrane protein
MPKKKRSVQEHRITKHKTTIFMLTAVEITIIIYLFKLQMSFYQVAVYYNKT